MTHMIQMEQFYWDRWFRDDDPDAGEQLIRLYMPLVRYHTQRIAASLPKGCNADELENYGLWGLYDALMKFDRTRDLHFSTYASIRVRGAIIDDLRRQDCVPRSFRTKVKQIEKATEILQQKYMRTVTIKELAEETGFTEEHILDIQSQDTLTNVLSIDEDYEDHNENCRYLSIEDQRSLAPELELLKKETSTQLAKIISTLSVKEQHIIHLFYKEEMTLTEIAHIVGLSISRISQIHASALFRLKQVFAKNGS